MKRFFIEKLEKWFNKANRKPLVLSGARQVGKTWVLEEFGRTHYKKVAYVNFDKNDPLKQFFKGPYDFNRILTGLQADSGVLITPGDTLVILDEIQECGDALSSLKYWQERNNDYHVASAGSLVGLALQSGTGYPVGKTNSMTLYPMSFGEFLVANGEEQLWEIVQGGIPDLINAYAERLEGLLKVYYLVGGMPAAVDAYVRTKSIDEARAEQEEILSDYDRDFAKHAPRIQVPRIRAIWKSLPVQLAREDKRFVAGDVDDGKGGGSRSRDLKDPFVWLDSAGLVHRVWSVSTVNVPLTAYETHIFKLYGLDVGLLSLQSGLSPRSVLEPREVFFKEFKGALTEQFVQQELRAAHGMSPHYWSTADSRTEVDFLVEVDGRVIPIEAKAEQNLRAKSLKSYRVKWNPVYAVRTSLSGLREDKGLRNIPLYAIGGENAFSLRYS